MADQQDKERFDISSQDVLRMAAEHPRALRKRITGMHASKLSELLLGCRDDNERLLLLGFIPEEQRGDVLLELPEGLQEYLLSKLAPSEIEDVLEHLDSDDAADILQAVDKDVADEVIERLEPEERRGIEALLGHDEESAGGLMQAELFKVRADWTVEKVLVVLRRFGHEIDNLNYVYVVDDNGRLVGVVPLHKLLFCEPDCPVSDMANRDFPMVHAGQDQEAVAQLFEKYDVLALPVVDDNGVLVGRITADDIIDVVQEEATEDMYRLAALPGDDDISEPVPITAWRRGIWLAVNLGTAILASAVVAQFQGTIAHIVSLAVLMPIVASMGGNAGTQTLTVIVRSLALGRVTFENSRRALIKEVLVSLLTGLGFALFMGAIAVLWFPALGIRLGLVMGAAMMINLLMAGMSGALIPLTLKRLHIDPALASGTILTTVTDVCGFFSFLGLATIFLL
jgi:magnesium transporter